ncbi:MAG TPA: hypothetical protein VJI97_02330 [Candidatus Nanoarchaeia archaeon]|nr:hypothetical protein [Candidatus Nanoarchaeia archaeon]
MVNCPKCGSKKTKSVDYLGAKVLKCDECGFDESSLLDVFPEDKSSQKAKGQYSPYKTGGSRRTQK